MRNRSNVVGIPSRLRARRYGIQVLAGEGHFFPFPKRPDRLWGPHNLLFNAYRSFITGGKRPGSEDNLIPPSSAEVKNEWSYTPGPLYTFMAWEEKASPLDAGISAHGMVANSRGTDEWWNANSNETKHLWVNSVIIQAFFRRDWEDPKKYSVRIICVLAIYWGYVVFCGFLLRVTAP
jgi:hypothetical protein